ncbi:MAG: MBL fold metallo-hydrolase [Mobilitalea sp.]
MGPQYPIIYEIGYHTYGINEYGMASFFVLVGDERGLVVDCGCGSFDAKKLVEELCPVPYDVVITHAHGDHCGAMGQWDKVWLHPADMGLMENKHRLFEMLSENPAIWKGATDRGIPMRTPAGGVWDYPGLELAGKDLYDFSKIKFMGFEKMPEILFLQDGQIFDLGGGRKVETVHVPGHSPGQCAFIDSGSRILFSGDSCNYNLGMSAVSVNTALKGLLKLDARRDQFDRNFNSHMGPAADTAGLSMPESTLDDCIWICHAALNGTAEYIQLNNGVRVRTIVRHGAVQVGLDPCNLIAEGEEPV